MKRWPMYTDIQSLKNLGFSKRQVAQKLGADFRTVSKYWDMDPETFERKIANRQRRRNLSLYEGVVLDWLKQHPGMTASQVLDWLKEHYQVAVSERATRRFVAHLREQNNIPKISAEKTRQYLAVEDPPMGYQMQVDIGVVHVKDARTISYRKLYCVACVLSHSRYKWGEWYAQALTAAQLVSALQECFEYWVVCPKSWFLIKTDCLPSMRITAISYTQRNLSSSKGRWASMYIFAEVQTLKAKGGLKR